MARDQRSQTGLKRTGSGRNTPKNSLNLGSFRGNTYIGPNLPQSSKSQRRKPWRAVPSPNCRARGPRAILSVHIPRTDHTPCPPWESSKLSIYDIQDGSWCQLGITPLTRVDANDFGWRLAGGRGCVNNRAIMELQTEVFKHEMAAAGRSYDKFVVGMKKTPDEFLKSLQSLMAKPTTAFQNRAPGL